jgi:hypothetical protein
LKVEFDAWAKQWQALSKATLTNLTIPLMLQLAVIYDAHVSGYYHKLKQIQRFDWLPEKIMSDCTARLKTQIAVCALLASTTHTCV